MYRLNDSQHLKIYCEIVLRSRYTRTVASMWLDMALASSKFYPKINIKKFC